MAMQTQWKTAGGPLGALRTGLDYSVMEPVARTIGLSVPVDEMTFSNLRRMESEAISFWSTRRG